MDRDAVKRLKDLKKKNARMKRLVADQQLDIRNSAGNRYDGILSTERRRRATERVTMVMEVS